MPTTRPRIFLSMEYDDAAEKYLRSLPMEHFMEATPQSTQRKITLESFDQITAVRPEVHLFNELLVQYPIEGENSIGQVVPDNMVVVHGGRIRAKTNFATAIEDASPLVVLEYVSKSSKRKDYEENMVKYERDLKVPYYLLFYPDIQDLTLFRYNGRKYVSVAPNDEDRLSIPELELEVAIVDEWVRYWFRGELLPLTGELSQSFRQTTKKLELSQSQLMSAEGELQAAKGELQNTNRKLESAQVELESSKHLLQLEERSRISAEEKIRKLEEELLKLRTAG